MPLRKPANALPREIIRFVLVGLLNTAFGYCIYAAGIFLGASPEVALIATFTLAAIFNYFTTGRIVFGNTGRKNFPRFAFAYVLIYGINVMMLRTLLGFGVQPLVAQAVLLPLVVFCTYIIMKFFVFRSSHAQNH